MRFPSILIVDDEAAQREVLAGYLRKKGYDVRQASSAQEALTVLAGAVIDIVLTDYKMPGGTGAELLHDVKARSPETTVVLMTAFGTIEGAVSALRSGAYDYLTKPIDLEDLDLLLQRIGERKQLISENQLLREQLKEKYSLKGIVSQSSAMELVLNTAGRVAASAAPVLIRGESGTGKELLAKAVHFASPRANGPFIAVNCAALNENLLESEMFGHEKGAFTGADRQRKGRFELAHGGTLFLDEIGDLPSATQVKLLRVLQERQFERVGGSETITADVRLIAATNRALETLIAEKTFREDLYYRINVVSIEIPPLRKRREDIPVLVEHFLEHYAKANERPKPTFTKEAWDAMLRHDYPGNIRELENTIQRAVILARDNLISSDELPLALQTHRSEGTLSGSSGSMKLPDQVERLEKQLIFDALQKHANNQSRAAEELGISERNLRYRLKKWGIK